jgi:hypothetical protein
MMQLAQKLTEVARQKAEEEVMRAQRALQRGGADSEEEEEEQDEDCRQYQNNGSV